MNEYTCPVCNLEFEIEDWDSGECPECNNGYSFDESCTGDYSDCWMSIEWERWGPDDT